MKDVMEPNDTTSRVQSIKRIQSLLKLSYAMLLTGKLKISERFLARVLALKGKLHSIQHPGDKRE